MPRSARSFRARLAACRVLVLALVLAPAVAARTAPGAASGAIPILERPVSVSARLDTAPGTPPGRFAFTLTVAHRDDVYTYRTELAAVSELTAAVAILKRSIGWRGGYLFVRQECGGGNAWRCAVDQIFALRHGRLVRIGEQLGGSRNQAPGSSYRNAHFVDVYDRLESNDLTSHAGAPWFRIYMIERNAHLEADLPFTWRMDRHRYDANRRELARVERDRSIDPRARDEVIASLLLHNAALARYCRQPDRLAATEREAKRLLSDERYRVFQRLVASVIPGELPHG